MKVEIIIDETIEETLVKIYSKTYSSKIEKIKNKVLGFSNDLISVFKDDEVFLLDIKEIVRIYAEDKKVYVETSKDKFQTKLKIYELEDRLSSQKFIRISRSEIINLSFVDMLDLSFVGTIAVKLKNGKVSYVSRRNLKNFKEAVGL